MESFSSAQENVLDRLHHMLYTLYRVCLLFRLGFSQPEIHFSVGSDYIYSCCKHFHICIQNLFALLIVELLGAVIQDCGTTRLFVFGVTGKTATAMCC